MGLHPLRLGNRKVPRNGYVVPVIRAIGVIFALVGATLLARSQPAPDLRPGATVVVKHDSSGSQLVNIAMLDAKYPPVLLQQQISKLGTEVGILPRGVSVFSQQIGGMPDQKLVKAQFAINRLVNRASGEMNLQAITRMFAGTPAPYTITVVKVIMDGEIPTSKTLRSYSNDGVSVDGMFTDQPPALEYLIYLKVQDPAKILIPLTHTEPPPVQPEKPAQGMPMANVLIPLVVLASVAAGALVYFLMLGRGGNGSPRNPNSRS